MTSTKKLVGKARRDSIIAWLKEETNPIKGTELANRAGVSRQVIVQDISLLKAKEEPIIATSQGYIYLTSSSEKKTFRRIIACDHSREQTKDELDCIVDQGVTVKNVMIEHPVYGNLEATLMVSNRQEVKQFMERISETNAPFLLELTDGPHLHTIEADRIEQLDKVEQQLKKLGILVMTS
ncbi:transcription repressor NadR [Paraliobacillus ryukyuensis]|uniref:transcription repressor NadR n=1 Tax=Paraliobacillus ryukyuensis TaxID=200904 RepID=UPI0009A8C68F|nr:transcription repressor NadR [Paraliobacillus ryukyuensis]